MLDPNFVLDDDSRDRLITRFGAGVDAWCAALPEMVERLCLRWHLELDKALSGNGSRVFVGRQHGDRGVVLKLTPDRAIANEEAIALRAWAATPHAVDLLDADLETGALLLEHIEPGTKVSDEPEVPPVNEVAELLTGLRETAEYDDGQLPALAQGMELMFARIGRLLSNPQVSPLVAPQMLDDGHRRARELASNGPQGLLHGDLHLSNILRAGRTRGLVAIDPRPGVGDLTFDAIDWALDRVTGIDEVHERIAQLCTLVPGLDRDRLWRWCQAIAAALAILRLRRSPPDDTTQLLLKLPAVSLRLGCPAQTVSSHRLPASGLRLPGFDTVLSKDYCRDMTLEEPDQSHPEDAGPVTPALRTVTDARTLRALAHPVRIALLEELIVNGAMTATEVGERIGESPTTCSFHLRQLARYGFVEEAGGGKGRARPWRVTTIGFSVAAGHDDPEAELASGALLRVVRERQLARYQTWLETKSSYPRQWREAADDSEYLFYVTPEELQQLNKELFALLLPRFRERLTDPSQRPPGAVPVEMLVMSFPLQLPPPDAGTQAGDTQRDGADS
jgi:streptomycin 6-kinase